MSKLLTTNKLAIANECIDKLVLDMDINMKEEMKGDLKNMYSKDESELLDSDLVENEDDFYYQSYLAMKKEVLDYVESDAFNNAVADAVTDAVADAVADAEEKALTKGREDGIEENKKDTIINAYKKNIPVATIAEICKTSLAKVNKIIKEYCL